MLNNHEEREAISNTHSHRHALRLIALGVLAAAITVALLAHAGLLTTVDVAHAQNQTQAKGWEGPASSASSEVASAQAQGQVLITFDNIPIGSTISNQYPQAMFSSDASNATVASDHNFGTSLPNISRRSLSSWNCCNGYAPLVIDFPNPVNDLAFHILAGDNFGTIGSVEVYQNNVWTATQPITGFGNPFSPIWYTGVSSYKNISRIRITGISDTNGLAFDNFSFTIAPTPTPTPLPSPTPTPPPAPTNVSVTPDENEIKLSWTPSTGADSYIVKRTETSAPTNERNEGAAVEEGSTFPAIVSGIPCRLVNGRCFYEDPTAADSSIKYTYVLAATNSSGTSGDSNPPASGSPLNNACSDRAYPTKTPPSPGPAGNDGWAMQYDFSEKDGLVISEVYLNGKRMAKRMSVPYFRLTTSKSGTQFGPTRGELTRTGSATGIRSRLVDYGQEVDANKIQIYAKYAVDRIPGTPKACLSVSQTYEFYRAGASPPDLQGECEPSGTVTPCHKFRPMIEYSFSSSGQGEALSSLNMPIRLHFQNTDATGNTVALTRDLDRRRDVPFNASRPFAAVFNPLTNSWWSQVFVQRSAQNPNKIPKKTATVEPVDNFHQTNNKRFVTLPSAFWTPQTGFSASLAGCPECIHFHWRWSSFLSGPNFKNGAPLLPPGSDQAVDIQINPYKGDEHPNDYVRDVFNPNDWLRNPTKKVNQPYDVVLWYSATGFAPHDTFFWHTAWFTPKKLDASSTAAVEPSSSNSNSASNVQDGPVSVNFGAVYEIGSTSFASYDLSTMPAMPQGFAALNNTAYLIDTTSVVSGPHVVNFRAESVTDQTNFNNLRIFYAEPDPFDPEKPMWMDATLLSPDSPEPSFSTKTLSARSEGLGVFVIGKLVQPPPTLSANLRLSCTDSQDPVTADDNLTYIVTVTNDGPQTATEVMLRNPLSPDVELVSATPSQGTCKKIDEIYCSLTSIAVGASATLTLVVKPTEGTVSFPAEGKLIANSAVVRAKEIDTDPTNDLVTEDTTILPNPNKPPTIEITSPILGAMVVGPASVTINAVAADTDGTIARVDFFDNGELIGAGAPGSGNSYSVTRNLSTCSTAHSQGNHPAHHDQSSCNIHTFRAVATDNGGRQNAFSVDLIVNGSATVSIASPSSGTLLSPGSTINLAANATAPSGISKVEFFANGELIGTGLSFAWDNISAGTYTIVAVATDGLGITTTSAPIGITVDAPPTVTMTTPANGAVFPSLTNISVSATAQSAHASIAKVEFYANGILIASATDVGTETFTATWRHLADGFYSLTAIATDNLGVSTTSPAITIGVNTPSPRPGEFIWFDDALPAGAVTPGGQEGWYWVDANPGSFSGTKSHQSRNFGQLDPPHSAHQHYFHSATATFPVNAGDKLFTYVFLDINHLPREIMLQWQDASGWEHRAYWGANNVNLGTDGTNSRRYMGPLPRAGTWVRLEVPANLVGLEGAMLNGMAFTLDGGRATFDLAGKTTANAPPPPSSPSETNAPAEWPPAEFVWFDDALPTGAVGFASDDRWDWISAPVFSGQRAHQTFFSSSEPKKFRQHAFTGAQTPMPVNPGDVLVSYVYLGNPDVNQPANTPDQIMLQWYDGTSWSHRAFWGRNLIGQNLSDMGRLGTESHRYMGGLPMARGWYRLEVPASYVGLEGKSVTGMAFSAYRDGSNPFVTWDRSGKSRALTTVPVPLSATYSIWRYGHSSYGWAFEEAERAPASYSLQKSDAFVAFPNQAAATVPLYRFSRPNTQEYFYATNRAQYDGHGWQYAGVAFYVFPDATTPGTVPLYLYHDNRSKYFLTVDQNEAAGMILDGISGYVYPANPPIAPTNLRINVGSTITLDWQDISTNETGFRVELLIKGRMVEVGVVGPNVTHYDTGITSPSDCAAAQVRAVNSVGTSPYAFASTCNPMNPPSNAAPYVAITQPGNGSVVDRDFGVTANAFDSDGNGTIAKVDFFSDGTKLGEVTHAPYVFVWNNAPPGTHSLTARATDAAGAWSVSTPVTVTAGINVALAANGATVGASSTFGSQAPTNAIDGDRKGHSYKWWADDTSFSYPDWIQVNFAGLQTINEISVFGLQQNYSNPVDPTLELSSTYALTNFEAEYWTGSSWARVPGGSVSGSNRVWSKFTFDSLTTSKIRVLITNVAGDNHSQVVEVEAYGVPATVANVALAANGATVNASSTYGSLAPANAIDGDRKGDALKWWTDDTISAIQTGFKWILPP